MLQSRVSTFSVHGTEQRNRSGLCCLDGIDCRRTSLLFHICSIGHASPPVTHSDDLPGADHLLANMIGMPRRSLIFLAAALWPATTVASTSYDSASINDWFLGEYPLRLGHLLSIDGHAVLRITLPR